MKVSAILDSIDLGNVALPEFQRGYVWVRDQVRGLVQSLYREYPVGSLLVWTTSASTTAVKGEAPADGRIVDLLLDGQQRITSLYGVIRGHAPTFFHGDKRAFDGLYFDLRTEVFEFYGPVKMKDDPLWVNVSELFKTGLAPWFGVAAEMQLDAGTQALYLERLNQITSIGDIDFHIERITGEKDVDEVVEIFNRVNSGGTKLSKGDLALARICGQWPDARSEIRTMTEEWSAAGFNFEVDWLLRCATAIATNQAPFTALKNIEVSAFADGLRSANRSIDFLLNIVSSRLGLDHDRVLAGRYAFTALSRFVDQHNGQVDDPVDQGKMLFWYVHSFIWGRYSGSTESILGRDLDALSTGGMDGLISELERWRGSLEVRPGDFDTATIGSRMYPLLYMMSRVGGAQDLISGLELSASMLGSSSKLEVHHIFPKALLYEAGYERSEVNAVANYCFLTSSSNKQISASNPAEYLAKIAEQQPEILASQWIPADPALWEISRYPEFLEARRELLSASANSVLDGLRSGATGGSEHGSTSAGMPAHYDESDELVDIVRTSGELGLAAPYLDYEIVDEISGEVLAIADAVWPNGAQVGLTQPLAFLPGPDEQMETRLGELGYRFYTEKTPLYWYFEKLTGIDLDGDGVVGNPAKAVDPHDPAWHAEGELPMPIADPAGQGSLPGSSA